MLAEFADELHVLAWQEVCLGDNVETGFCFGTKFFNPLDILLEQIFACNLFIPKEMINFLEVKQLLDINLWLRPRPQQIPRCLQIHSMRQFVPILSSMEGIIDDIIDILFLSYYSIQENRLIFRLL